MIKSDDLEVITPCVSVIVTTFNRKFFLSQTINSILEQSFNDFELIIVDNMSVDGTSDYVLGIADPRVRYFRNSNNGVIAVNRNYGIGKAKGQYVAFCDDDDLWLMDKLRLQVAQLKGDPSIAMCYTNAESFVGDVTLSHKMIRRVVYKYHFLQLLRGNFIPNSSVLIRRDIFIKLGLLNEVSSLREDYEMWLRVTFFYAVVGINSSLIRYRMHSSNVGGNRASETLRAIRTLKSVTVLLGVPKYIVFPNIGFQYIKYFCYKMLSRL